MSDIANIIARRDRVSKASLANIQLLNSGTSSLHFRIPKMSLFLKLTVRKPIKAIKNTVNVLEEMWLEGASR